MSVAVGVAAPRQRAFQTAGSLSGDVNRVDPPTFGVNTIVPLSLKAIEKSPADPHAKACSTITTLLFTAKAAPW